MKVNKVRFTLRISKELIERMEEECRRRKILENGISVNKIIEERIRRSYRDGE